MPNVFITHREFVEGMLESARRTVDDLPLETVKKLAANPFEGAPAGIKAGLCVTLIIAARERLKKLEGSNAESPIIP